MHELIFNLHIHTCFSDGSGLHRDIAQVALHAGLDGIIITDHNLLLKGLEGYYQEGNKRILLLVGEEIHNQSIKPQKNHLLVIGAGRELANTAENPGTLIDEVSKAGGLSFLAHPIDPLQPAFDQPDISWIDWSVEGYTGIELWNGFSEFKSLIKTKLMGLFYGFFPGFIAHSPFSETLVKWDELLAKGRHIVAIGGSDAHALHIRIGPLRRVIFPYEYHFAAINTHLLVQHSLCGDLATDRIMILKALSNGNAFVGYDKPLTTRGFRFSAQNQDTSVIMGEEIASKGGVTLQAHLPGLAEIHLVKDGQLIRKWRRRESFIHITTQPGIYRLEAYRYYLGRWRGWIFSNPIYIK